MSALLEKYAQNRLRDVHTALRKLESGEMQISAKERQAATTRLTNVALRLNIRIEDLFLKHDDWLLSQEGLGVKSVYVLHELKNERILAIKNTIVAFEEMLSELQKPPIDEPVELVVPRVRSDTSNYGSKQIVELYLSGMKVRHISAFVGASRQTIYNILKKEEYRKR